MLILIWLPSGFLWGQLTAPSQERVESLENSPARQRLNEIQPYKPTVRRSRRVATRELETQIKDAEAQLALAEKVMRSEEKKMESKADDAWTAEQLAAAERSIEQLEEVLDGAREQLAVAKVEEAKVQSFFAREKAAGRVARNVDGEKDEEDDEEDEDGEEEGEGGANEDQATPGNAKPSPGKSRGRSRGEAPAKATPEPDVDQETDDDED